MGTHSGAFAWKIPWAEEHSGLQSVGSQRVKLSWGTNTFTSVTALCPNLCDPVACSLPHSSLHGIFQARIPEWVAVFFSPSPLSPGSSQFKDRICFSYLACGLLHGRRILYCWATSAGLYINIHPIYGYFSQVYFGNFCVISFPRWYGDYICVCTSSVQFTQSCLILCDPMDSCRPSLPVSLTNNKGQLFFTFMALLDIINQIASLIK